MQSRQYGLSPLYIQVKIRSIIIQLRELRIDKCLSQRQLADLIGVRKGTISDMENFKYMPKIDLIIKYANAVGYNLKLDLF